MAMRTAKQYVESLRKLNTRVYMFGEKIENWVDHPMIRPSINCVAMTYATAQDPQYADLMTVESSLTGHKINRFTHLHQSTEDLINKPLFGLYLLQERSRVGDETLKPCCY